MERIWLLSLRLLSRFHPPHPPPSPDLRSRSSFSGQTRAPAQDQDLYLAPLPMIRPDCFGFQHTSCSQTLLPPHQGQWTSPWQWRLVTHAQGPAFRHDRHIRQSGWERRLGGGNDRKIKKCPSNICHSLEEVKTVAKTWHPDIRTALHSGLQCQTSCRMSVVDSRQKWGSWCHWILTSIIWVH